MYKFSHLTALTIATLCTINTFAANYYVSPTGSADTNSGTSTASPWKTLNKVNNTAIAGDTVYLQAGGTWRETLQVKSGVSYNSYGTGATPIISGSKYVGGLNWSRKETGSNIWVATTDSTVETGAIRHLYLNGTRLNRARAPNIGQGDYQAVNSASRYFAITSTGAYNTLNIAANIVASGKEIAGASAFVRTYGSDLTESVVTAPSTGPTTALTLQNLSVLDDWGQFLYYDNPQGYGYWLENKLWMLDSAGEWYFDSSNHKLYVWMPLGNSPQGQPLYAASQSNAIVATNATGFSIIGIEARETMSDAISISGSNNSTSNPALLFNVTVNRSGRRGISAWNSSNINIYYGNVMDSYGTGIWLGDMNGGPTASQPAKNVNIQNSSIINSGKNGLAAIGVMLGDGGTFSNNQVVNSSGGGVFVLRNYTLQKNLVQNSCTDFEDCGGVYVAKGFDPKVGTNGRFVNNVTINNNIIDGGTGTADGVPAGAGTDTKGIYLDDLANGNKVTNNYISGFSIGNMLHSAYNNTITGNSTINSRYHSIKLQEEASVAGVMRGNTINSNIFVESIAKPSFTPTIFMTSGNGSAGPTSSFASFDLNKYANLNYIAQNSFTQDILVWNYGTDLPITQSGMNFGAWQNWGQTTGVSKDTNGSYRRLSVDGYNSAYGDYNPVGAPSKTINCPIANDVARCNSFVNFATSQPITFPISLPGGSSIIVVR